MYFNEDVSNRMNFDLVSFNYHKSRPEYPNEMYQDIAKIMGVENRGSQAILGDILEVGSGSGQATKALAAFSESLDCVEPGENFVRLLEENYGARPGVSVHHTSYEKYLPIKKYDLIFSGCAFHWISKEVVFGNSRNILKENGWLMAVWNMPRFSDSVYSLMERLIVPFDKNFDIPRGTKEQLDYFDEGFNDFSKNRGFTNCSKKIYEGKRLLSDESLVNLIWSYVNLSELSYENSEDVFQSLLSGVDSLKEDTHEVHNYYPFASGQRGAA